MSPPSSPTLLSRWPIVLVGAACLAVAWFGTASLRDELANVDTSSIEALRDFVASKGWWGIGVYVVVVVFRGWFLLPSFIILPVGGLLFGFSLGTALGALAIWISCWIRFAATRLFVRGAFADRLPDAVRTWEQRMDRAGSWVVAAAVAHPLGPLGPIAWAAGLTAMSVFTFSAALLPAGLLRAAASSVLGAGVADWGIDSVEFWLATAGLVAMFGIPLLHPGLRGWLFGSAPPEQG